MEALILRSSLIALSLFVSTGATYQTRNFTVTAPTAEVAEEVGRAAEIYRRDLAIFWLEQPLPNWSRPCKLRVRTGSIGAGGETRFQFSGGEVLNWNMYVQGSLERILDSVLPHEVNHTIFACHFRRPLPRWADEGAATLFEHRSEQMKQLSLLNQVIRGNRDYISLRNLLTMKEYPKSYRPMLILYAEGYALADFLVQQGGRKRYLKFLVDGERMGWPEAIKANYHHGGVESLEKNWQGWVMAGMPKLHSPPDQMIAEESGSEGLRPAIFDEYKVVSMFRSQSPDGASGQTRPGRRSRPPATAGSGRATADVRSAGGSNGASDAVFVGLPSTKRTGNGNSQVRGASREASFEAPRPLAGPGTEPPGSRQPVSQPRQDSRIPKFFGREQVSAQNPSGLERTKISQRTHLPQERTEVTGSIPQWAGFPGQKELF